MTVYNAEQRQALERVLEAAEAALAVFPAASRECETFAVLRSSLIQVLGERRLRALA